MDLTVIRNPSFPYHVTCLSPITWSIELRSWWSVTFIPSPEIYVNSILVIKYENLWKNVLIGTGHTKRIYHIDEVMIGKPSGWTSRLDLAKALSRLRGSSQGFFLYPHLINSLYNLSLLDNFSKEKTINPDLIFRELKRKSPVWEWESIYI